MRAPLPAALLATLALALAGTAHAGAPGSADVAALQVGLTGRGLYDDDVDGFAGPKTLAGLRRLQGATSPLASETRAALGTFGAAQLGSRPLTLGSSGWDVASILSSRRRFRFEASFASNRVSQRRRPIPAVRIFRQ